jgi:hypothetical protein
MRHVFCALPVVGSVETPFPIYMLHTKPPFPSHDGRKEKKQQSKRLR